MWTNPCRSLNPRRSLSAKIRLDCFPARGALPLPQAGEVKHWRSLTLIFLRHRVALVAGWARKVQAPIALALRNSLSAVPSTLSKFVNVIAFTRDCFSTS
jgi:hypothetical protein